MRYTVPAAEFPAETHPLEVEIRSIWSAPELLLGGVAVPRGRGSRHYHVIDAQDVERRVELKTRVFYDTIPDVWIDGAAYQIVPPLPWHLQIWAALPLLLVVVGGAVGGVVGAIGAMLNFRLLRTDLGRPRQLLLMGGVSAGAALVYFALAIPLVLAIEGLFSRPSDFSSAEGRFSVRTPITLSQQTQMIPLPDGDEMPLILHFGERRDLTVVVSYFDMPDWDLSEANTEIAFEDMRDSMLASFEAPLHETRRIEIGGLPAYEVIASGPEVALLMRSVLHERRLYLILAAETSQVAPTPVMRAFVESFVLSE